MLWKLVENVKYEDIYEVNARGGQEGKGAAQGEQKAFSAGVQWELATEEE